MCAIVDFISAFYSNLSDWRSFWGSKSQKTVSIQIRLQNLCTFCILGLEGSMDILEVCKMCGIVGWCNERLTGHRRLVWSRKTSREGLMLRFLHVTRNLPFISKIYFFSVLRWETFVLHRCGLRLKQRVVTSVVTRMFITWKSWGKWGKAACHLK